MLTKIEAARIAANAGVRTVITDGQKPQNLPDILVGAAIGTQFSPKSTVANARKRWIAQSLLPAGKLYLDEGAVRAIQKGGNPFCLRALPTLKASSSDNPRFNCAIARVGRLPEGLSITVTGNWSKFWDAKRMRLLRFWAMTAPIRSFTGTIWSFRARYKEVVGKEIAISRHPQETLIGGQKFQVLAA
jgi:hypothetical protein